MGVRILADVSRHHTHQQRRIRTPDDLTVVGGSLNLIQFGGSAALRRDKRRLEMEVEILRRATAFFARDHLPKWVTRWSVNWPPKESRCG